MFRVGYVLYMFGVDIIFGDIWCYLNLGIRKAREMLLWAFRKFGGYGDFGRF